MGYQEDEVWKKLQSYLPESFRLTDALCPSEQYIHYFKQDIHIDLYPQEQPKGSVVLLHGVGGNGRLLSCFALLLWQQGYEVVCPDLPLYGYTKGADRITYDLWVECAIALVRQYARDNIPLFVFGSEA